MMRITPEKAGCDCGSCPFAKNGKPNRPVLAVGPSRPIAVVVAESPGSEEVDRGEPLVGNTGREFNAVLEGCGLERRKLLLIHAMCCKPSAARSEKDMKAAVKSCRPYVAAVLEQYDNETPMLICGKWAFVSITGRLKGHGNERGFLQKDIGTLTAGRTLRGPLTDEDVDVRDGDGDGEEEGNESGDS